MKENRFEKIIEISEKLAMSVDIDKLLPTILEEVTKILDGDASSLWLLKDDTLYFKAATGEKLEMLKNIKVQKGKGIIGQVAENMEPLIIPCCENDPAFNKKIADKTGYIPSSIICVPLFGQQKTLIGVVEVLRSFPSPFDKDDVQFLASVSSMIGKSLKNALEVRKLKEDFKKLRNRVEAEEQVVIVDEQMEKLYQLGKRIAPLDVTVLIMGETGAGKEVLAEHIYRMSNRKGPFITLNCASIPEELFESELFGFEKGSFTGAIQTRKGKFELAEGGTVFLDEIGELPLKVQSKLLRVLEARKISKIGSEKEISIDVKLIAATNRNLGKMIAENKFRMDLYYRLNEFSLEILPLRKRPGEIVPLANLFISKFSKNSNVRLSMAAKEKLMTYVYPGNVRELKNIIKKALILMDGDKINVDEIQFERLPGLPMNDVGFTIDSGKSLEEVEIEYILKVLKENGLNKEKALQILQITRPTLNSKLKKAKEKYNMDLST
ncbi:sigma 54-interacting transcriptional regulator [bacterium]|nr:sigma 54-interacting transcriptional regulator [bacterium]